MSLTHADAAAILADGQLRAALHALPDALLELRCERFGPEAVQALEQVVAAFGPARIVVACRAPPQLPATEAAALSLPLARARQRAVYAAALACKVAFVDVDGDLWRADASLRRSLQAARACHADGQLPSRPASQLIVSEHRFDRHPSIEELAAATLAHRQQGADVVKWALPALPLAASAASWHWASQLPTDCPVLLVLHGEAGLFSRLRYPGRRPPPLTYWCLQAQGQTAPGQPSWQRASRLYRYASQSEQVPLYGLLGAPLVHSWSPALHNGCLAAWQRPGLYLPFLAPTEADAQALLGALGQQLGLQGLSVTLPHKRLAIECARPTPAAQSVGAANTLWRTVGGSAEQGEAPVAPPGDGPAGCAAWQADNTDVGALAASLHALVPAGLAGRRVAVLGSGGVARAACRALRLARAKVVVVARRPRAALTWAAAAGAPVQPMAQLQALLPHLDGLVQCTPMGMAPNEATSLLTALDVARLPGTAFVLDTIYRPVTTRLVAAARASGRAALGGLPMFLAQAQRQCELLYGRRPSEPLLRSVLAEQIDSDGAQAIGLGEQLQNVL